MVTCQALSNKKISGAIIKTGQWEGKTLVFRGEFSAHERKLVLRNAVKLMVAGMASDEFSSANGAPEKVLVHVEATKRP